MRPVPEKIHIFAQQMLDSKNGLSFELGYIAYDANFKCIEIIDTQKLSKSNGAVKLANDETGRFNKEAYSIVKLNQIPPEVFCLTFGISEVFNKKLNGSMGCFFRVYDAKDDFELMSFDGRRKGLYTSIWVFTMFRYNNNEWAIVPMNRSYNDRGLVKGMLALSQHIKEDMQKEKYFDRMYAQIKIDF
ncbi:stress-induced protein [Histomonas meleagridis]|uniref:stress-induced protein n=1 Tax=Histomonas meleagridis TaxID=135588 RepID=UPI003559694D|nr:stress-induced protein [Histomonas meleagridis]KAH0798719.1 stress-induced protein [Histomonas meleagridis]